MSAKYNFRLESQGRRRELPRRLIIGRQSTETAAHVVLKLLAFLLFCRERLQIQVNLHIDTIPFVPDLVQLDYELRPKLWIECGECGVSKLHKLAAKAPEAEIWIVKRSLADAQHLLQAMEKAGLRRDRYQVLGLDAELVDELCGLLQTRNEILWVSGDFEQCNMQFDFNSLWFDTAFTVTRF